MDATPSLLTTAGAEIVFKATAPSQAYYPVLQEISFFEQGEPVVDGDAGDLKVQYSYILSSFPFKLTLSHFPCV
jgi:hypothetical protein